MRIALAASAALLLGMSSTASATTLIELTTDQLIDAADTIVRGTVTEVWTEQDHESSYVWTHAQVEVTRVLKGDVSTELIVIEQPGGSWANMTTTVSGIARFSVGEEGIFFVEQKASRITPVGMFQGKFNVMMDPYARDFIVHRFALPQSMDFDHRFIPLPAEANRVSLVDFEDQILLGVADGWDGQPIPGVNSDKLRTINSLSEERR
jgi:hypothetical protein